MAFLCRRAAQRVVVQAASFPGAALRAGAACASPFTPRGALPFSSPLPVCVGQAPRRAFGVMDTIRDKMDEKGKAQQLAMFKEQIAKMANGPAYTLAMWNSELDEAMSSWRMKVPGASSQPEAVKMEVFRVIMAKMTPEQKANPGILLKDGKAAGRLAADSGKTADDVRAMVNRFNGLVIFQDFVKARKAEGKRMPHDLDEMQQLVTADVQKKRMKGMRAAARRF